MTLLELPIAAPPASISCSTLRIFVHRASECLTDHASHGDGLICFSLLNGLAQRGHHVYAYADDAPVLSHHPRLQIRAAKHRSPMNSLARWEQAWRADRWLAELQSNERMDIVWRMHPYGLGCPRPPRSAGRPLVVGPLFYEWPRDAAAASSPPLGRPRLGIGIGPLLDPLARRGWHATLSAASLILCATEPHARAMRDQYPRADVQVLPVIVEPPDEYVFSPRARRDVPMRLVMVANLVPNKNPLIFCQTIQHLRANGIPCEGILIGDGPLRGELERYCSESGLAATICFKGCLPNAEVYRHLHDADYLISCSVGEPYGRNIVEAMSVGTPCICHRSGGPADFIEHDVDGLLVDAKDAAAFAREAARALADATLCERLSRNAYAKSRAWSADRVLSQLESLLSGLA